MTEPSLIRRMRESVREYASVSDEHHRYELMCAHVMRDFCGQDITETLSFIDRAAAIDDPDKSIGELMDQSMPQWRTWFGTMGPLEVLVEILNKKLRKP